MTAPAPQFLPADEGARRRIREGITENLCVEAGAGTGKTTVLVDRIVNIIRAGEARVDEIAVMTFTEKTATELAARVRLGLDDAALTATGEEAERIAAAIGHLSRAHIETIHAFAASLLKERPIEAGLDPGFEVLVDLHRELHVEAAYDEWLTGQMTATSPPEALLHALNLQLDVKQIRAAAEHLQRHRDLLPVAAYERHPEIMPASIVDELAERVEAVRHLLPVDPEDGAHKSREELATLVAALAAARERPSAFHRTIVAPHSISAHKGNQRNWPHRDHCVEVKAALEDCLKILKAVKDTLRQNGTADVIEWLQEFVAWYDARRKAEGKADYEDLLVWARNLLRDSPEVRAYFQQKYRRVLVDEFQDTDPLQVEMILYLCANELTEKDALKLTLRPGSLFVVGDPKQSIYRFRRADIAMYDTVRTSLFASEMTVPLSQNFRSVPPIIEWVNRVFDQLIRREEHVQPQYIPLHARANLPPHPWPPVQLLELGDATSLKIDQMRRLEAEGIARLLRDAITDGRWQVRGTDDVLRNAGWRDVAILIARRTNITVYEDALRRAGIPYRHEGARTFFAQQAVRELIAVLRAIDDPTDSVAAIAALRSAAFGCSDEELFLHRAAGGGFDFLRVRGEAVGPVADALRRLRAFSRLRSRRAETEDRLSTGSLPELVRAVIDQTRLVEFAMLQPQGDQAAANLLKMIDQAREFAGASGGGLRAFVRWLKENVDREADDQEATISEDTDDVVRMVTIHASKGLEFPVVVFANQETNPADRTETIAERVGGRRLHVKLGSAADGFVTPGWDVALAREAAQRAAEEQRLLYVAGTRARDVLVVPFFSPGPKPAANRGKALAQHLRDAGAYVGESVRADSGEPLPARAPVFRIANRTAPAADSARIAGERAAWEAGRHRHLVATREGLRIVTATSLKPEWDAASAHQDEGVRRGRAADFGIAVHSMLERLDFGRPQDIDTLAAAAAREHGMEQRAQEMAATVRAALGSAVMARAMASPRLLREVGFVAPLPDGADGVAEGRIDLMFEEDGGIVVIDYKTDRTEEPERYETQAMVYAWAAHRATGLPVREVVLLFARTGAERAFACHPGFMSRADAMMALAHR